VAERFLILAVIVTAVAVIWLGLRWRTSRVRRHGALDLVRLEHPAPLVLAFSTPECVPCRTQQKPALDELLRRYPDLLEVREVVGAEERRQRMPLHPGGERQRREEAEAAALADTAEIEAAVA